MRQFGLEIERGSLRSVKAVERVLKNYRVAGLIAVLQMAVDVFGRKDEMSGHVIDGLSAFLARYGPEADTEIRADPERMRNLLAAAGQRGMLANARGLQAAHHGMPTPTAWGISLREMYNKGLRTNKLGPWAEKVLSPGGRERIRAKGGALNGS